MGGILRLFTAMAIAMALVMPAAASELSCWFPPNWKEKGEQAKKITDALSRSGVAVKPRIAKSYPEILDAFASGEGGLVYVGSFVQAIIRARDLGTPLVQAIDGKELYGSLMVYPKGQNPEEILKKYPKEIAFAKAASSGESGAKAATDGQAAIETPGHPNSVGAVKAGKAKAAFVKNGWWNTNKKDYPEFDSFEVPGVSDALNPDNVLTASKKVSEGDREKLKQAAIAAKEVFGANEMVAFSPDKLDFTLELMKKGKIDPLKYAF